MSTWIQFFFSLATCTSIFNCSLQWFLYSTGEICQVIPYIKILQISHAHVGTRKSTFLPVKILLCLSETIVRDTWAQVICVNNRNWFYILRMHSKAMSGCGLFFSGNSKALRNCPVSWGKKLVRGVIYSTVHRWIIFWEIPQICPSFCKFIWCSVSSSMYNKISWYILCGHVNARTLIWIRCASHSQIHCAIKLEQLTEGLKGIVQRKLR